MMKYLFLMLLVPVVALAADAPMDYAVIFEFLKGLAPWVSYVLIGLGSLVVIGMGVDYIIPDSVDKGFMGKILNVPILGMVLKALSKFSPFNFKDPTPPAAQ